MLALLALWEEPLGAAPSDQQPSPDPQIVFLRSVKKLNLQTDHGLITESHKKPFSFPNWRIPWWVWASALGLGSVLIVWSLLRQRQKSKQENKVIKGPEPEKQVVDPTLLKIASQRADELANQGLWTEAMHALLLGTFEELGRQRKLTFPGSMTSREVVASLTLGPAASESLGQIVSAVEPTWFGCALPSLEDYLGVRAHFDGFVKILSSSTLGLPKQPINDRSAVTGARP
jgi:hypothetical protein